MSEITFQDLALADPIQRALRAKGYTTPSPIQAQAIPVVIEGKDVIASAQTGTGKTAAFALPLLERLESGQKTPQALVLAPTRELAMQVADSFKAYAARRSQRPS